MTVEEIKSFRIELSSRLMELGNLLFAGAVLNIFLANDMSLQLISGSIILGLIPYIASYIIRK